MKSRFKTVFKVLFLIAIFISLSYFFSIKLNFLNHQGQISTNSPAFASLNKQEKKKYYFIKNLKENPKVTATSYAVGDLDTGEIILFKEKDKQLPIASISKLMTALVAKENIPSGESILISENAINTYGENGNFTKGETITIDDILYPLLLESSNDAGTALAEFLGKDLFIEKMNKKAEELKMNATSFSEPTGLNPENVSSANDLLRLAQFLNKEKKDILDLTTKKSFFNKKHSWSNNNKFVNQSGYKGGKTGFIDESGQTLLSVFSIPLGEEGQRDLGIIVLDSNDRYEDVNNLIRYLKRNIYYGSEQDANLTWVKQREGVPDLTEKNFVNLTFFGDIMMDRGVKSSVMKNFAGDYAMLFEHMNHLKDKDIVFGNLEGPAGVKGKDLGNLYSFQMDPTVIPALKGAGFDVLSVANNHVGDWGRVAFEETLARLEENELLPTGGGINKFDAEKPRVIEKHGMKIGFLGFSDVGPSWMQAKNILEENSSGILLASDPRFEEIIQNAKKEVDFLVVSFHFGEEYKTIHNERQEYLAHKAIDNGAKFVIGHHPHVIQDTEIYKDGFIAYSLGNFIFDQYFSTNTMKGMQLDIKLWRDGNIDVTKNTVFLSRAFQPEKIEKGKEEKIKFDTISQ